MVSQRSQRPKTNKQHLEQVEDSRPFTVDENLGKRIRYFEPVAEQNEDVEEEDVEDNLNASPAFLMNQTGMSFRRDTVVCTCSQCLLLNSTQSTLLESSLGVKCDEAFIMDEAIKKIKKSLTAEKRCLCKRGYKYLIIDTHNLPQRLPIQHLLAEVGPLYQQMSEAESETVHKLDVIVFLVENNPINDRTALEEEIGDANVQLVHKPVTTEEVKALFLDQTLTPTSGEKTTP